MAPKTSKSSDEDFLTKTPNSVSYHVVGNVRLSQSGKGLNLELTAKPSRFMTVPISDIRAILDPKDGQKRTGTIRVYPDNTPEE